MTKRYPGGYITKTPPTVSTTSAPGIWTMEQQAAYQKAGTWPFGGPFNYIEDVFSTWLYTGNGSTQTITNGIDLAGQGGLTWIKKRNAAEDHILTDTVRGAGNTLFSNLTSANEYDITRLSAFTSSGFSVGTSFRVNQSSNTYASWTFRKQPKFFDVVTYTGNATARTIAHNLGSVPGCIIVKRTDSTGGWYTYHRSTGADKELLLNSTASAQTDLADWNNTSPTATEFSVGTPAGTNINGATYVAYLFAHNAGGFGLTGTDNVISCGSFTTDAGGAASVTLGYEPQWLLMKNSSGTADSWVILDNMRGWNVSTNDAALFPNSSAVEGGGDYGTPNATGFTVANMGNTKNFIYIAIRRGPMKTPTSGTSVFSPITYAGNSTASRVISGLINAPDWVLYTARNASAGVNNHITGSRLQGGGRYLLTEDTSAETSSTAYGVQTYGQTSVTLGTATTAEQNASGVNYILYGMGRAPGFFDVVCYTGTGSARTVTHNLGVAPELMILKTRTGSGSEWPVYVAPLGATQGLYLGPYADPAITTSGYWNNTSPTSSVFTVGNASASNFNGGNFVAYLFASCPGVSKVGSYTGTGGTQTISCGFAARFVLIKRTDSTGDWFVWDTARGMVAGTDPRLALNSTAAETNANWVYTDASGFQIVTTDATVNASGGSYIYLAIS